MPKKGRFLIDPSPHDAEASIVIRESAHQEQPPPEGSRRVLASQIIISMVERMLEYGGDMEVRLQFEESSYVPGLEASVAPEGYLDTLLLVPDGEPFGSGWIKEDGTKLRIKDFHDLIDAIGKRLNGS